MNKINFNEVRKICKKEGKTRPILSGLHIKDGKAYATNRIYLIVMGGYEHTPNMTLDLDTYRALAGEYPNISQLVDKTYTTPSSIKTGVKEGKIYYEIDETYFIDDEMIKQVERLVNIKKWQFSSFNGLRTNKSVALIQLDEDNKIYFSLKHNI